MLMRINANPNSNAKINSNPNSEPYPTKTVWLITASDHIGSHVTKSD